MRHITARLSKHTEMNIESGSGYLFQWDIPSSCKHARVMLRHVSASIIKPTPDELKDPETFMRTT